MLLGWTRQMMRADDVVLYVLYADSVAAYEEEAVLPGRSIVATPHSVLLFVEDWVLRSEFEVRSFVDMVVDAWYDVRDLQAGRALRDTTELDASEAVTLGPGHEERLPDLRDGVVVEDLEAVAGSARANAVVAKVDGVVVACDGVALRSARDVRVFAQRLVATWSVVGYLRTGNESPMHV
ncbi:hypothetical protein LVJ94_00305 [Pendulispora rubella]|uniref:Uncharacterized protein n=1 Tax=Pendulispora rubella TaxID=2741070 RepID=A0ABZ2L4K4_9BACT